MNKLLQSKYRPILIGIIAIVALPFVMLQLGQTVNTATVVVILAIAAMGLNILVGFTGLVSFGHSAWFGIGAYAAALAQLHWFEGQIWVPLVFSLAFVGLLALVVGLLILRRKGVYFALMTLALAALSFNIAFRWSELTGGEDGLGGLQRGTLGPIDLDDSTAFYVFIAVVAVAVLYGLLRLIRSPFGHVLEAIRENEERAGFQGYNVQRYKLAAFVLSAMVTGLAGALTGFQHYIVSAEATSVVFSGELLAMVVIGGMRNLLGPAIGVLFYILFRELFSIWTANWLLFFGIIFVSFVIYSPNGLVGVWGKIRQRWHPDPKENAAMSNRKIYEGLNLPGFLQTDQTKATVLEVRDVSKYFGGISAIVNASLTLPPGKVHALIGPNGAGKTTLFNLISGQFAPDEGSVRLHGREITGRASHEICQQGIARSFQITNLFKDLSIYENLRLSVQANYPSRFNAWRDADSYDEVNQHTRELIRFLGLEGIEQVKGSDLSYGGQRLVDMGIALASKPQLLLLDEPLAGLAAAERERVSNLVKAIGNHIPVLIVEHDIDRVLDLSHDVTVMNQGEVLMTGNPDAVRNDRRVQEVYTGSGTPVATGRAVNAEGEARVLLEVTGVNTFYGKSHILNDASLNIRKGEIVALLGRNGAGKSTLLKTLAGLVPAASGSIRFDERELTGLEAHTIARAGIGYVPQGRGLFAGMSVADNLSLGRLARATESEGGIVWSEEQIFDYFPVLKTRLHTAADYLSGGEQQMLSIARALSGEVKLLLLDEPFEGLAPAIIEELFVVLDRLRLHLPILIVEHNLDIVLALADRVFALENGAVFHEGPAEELLTNLAYRKEILWL
ncbi:MAG: ATP-binding cassette domain-containing protein [Rhodospirillales bacterium]|nr:ATP-binding cassette domain-containing protein [Rhodospirillales bacterium]